MPNQDFNETLGQVITYVLRRVSSSKAGDKDALIQEYIFKGLKPKTLAAAGKD